MELRTRNARAQIEDIKQFSDIISELEPLIQARAHVVVTNVDPRISIEKVRSRGRLKPQFDLDSIMMTSLLTILYFF